MVYYSSCSFLFHLDAGGTGCVEVCSPSWCGWAIRCLILRRWSVVVVVVLWAVGGSRPAGRGISVFCTRWASSDSFPWHASSCRCSCGCSIRGTACSPSTGWAPSRCSPGWWAPWWRGDGHGSLRGVNLRSAFSLWWLLFCLLYPVLLARLAVRAFIFFGIFFLKCRFLFCFLRIAFFVLSLVEGNWWGWSLDVELLFCCGIFGV